MTTTPNDAAVNAESEIQPCPWCGESPYLSAVSWPRGFEITCLNDDCLVSSSANADTEAEVIAAWNNRSANLIERHATPQATHGEGEAVFYTHQKAFDLAFNAPGLAQITVCKSGYSEYSVPLYTHPAPSPTPNQHTHADQCWTWGPKHYECALERIRAVEGVRSTTAPALGELAKRLIARAKASAYLGHPHTEDADLMQEAAAALSGVAAQGETPSKFVEYIAKNYSGEVFFSDPKWHADHIWRQAQWCAAQGDGEALPAPELVDRFDAAYKLAYDKAAEKPGATLSDLRLAGIRAGVAAMGADQDGEARVSEDAEFELYCDDEPVASASGPRKDALREIHHYALQYNQDGAVRIEEVIRKPLSAIENVMSLGVADQEGKAA